MTLWLILTATLPTTPSGLRVRVWRALKATGAGTLREGVYVLPEHAPTARALCELAATIREAGAEAHLLHVPAHDEAQELAFRALFDRREACAELLQSIRQTRAALKKASEAQLRKTLRTLEQQGQAIQASDFFPGPASEKAAEALAALRVDIERHLSPGEPCAADLAIEPRDIADHQGRTWATRKRPWVDRLATAWLVQRFIDRSPRFIWLADPAKCPKAALGYDFDGATFTHVGDRVTFEVVAESFALLGDPALRRLAALVHCIDVGGAPVDEAPGVEAVVRGLQALHARDDALLAAAVPLFDALYAALQLTRDDH
ncbi:chromate resistance protein ChrB domain-containing protein [Piscinibacter sp. HJYY11]|uniref:chromate resistance protein ChrB domain-containing protein n=1 Tax=Piscinibacter sp. HJYY11 TaxID=2801333 RepID=UPI00191CD8A6|nr:chromate resistance protein ChrB domain-containing protein [Piscinibacter sp. HJYY11]MBL0728909.1 chromate resistance protein [Piscinibacter sp. HJYY11]